jgi:hypothetical protein
MAITDLANQRGRLVGVLFIYLLLHFEGFWVGHIFGSIAAQIPRDATGSVSLPDYRTVILPAAKPVPVWAELVVINDNSVCGKKFGPTLKIAYFLRREGSGPPCRLIEGVERKLARSAAAQAAKPQDPEKPLVSALQRIHRKIALL